MAASGSFENWRRRALLAFAVAGGLLASTLLLVLNGAAFLGVVPFNAGWEQAQAEEPGAVTIFIRSNGVHTWIVMPKVSGSVDWRNHSLGEHLRDPRYGAASHIAVGYGNREFYLNTPTWADLTFSRAIGAFSGGGRSLLHVEHVHDPRPEVWQRPIVLRREEYARLADFVLRRFQLDGAGRTLPVLGRGYGPYDMFYEANGGYSLYLTCNEWTGRALRHAGVRTGFWTPMNESIMWRLD